MKKLEKSPRETTTVRLPPDLWRTCKIQAVQEGRHASDLLEDALIAYLSNGGKLLSAAP